MRWLVFTDIKVGTPLGTRKFLKSGNLNAEIKKEFDLFECGLGYFFRLKPFSKYKNGQEHAEIVDYILHRDGKHSKP